MSSLLGQLMATARKAEIGYGIHSNCFITKVSNEVRQSKEGEKLSRNGYTTIGQKDENGQVISEKEIYWFNLDPTSEKVYNNWYSQYEQMAGIVNLYQGKKNRFAEGLAKILEENGVEVDWDAETPAAIAEFEKSMKEVLSKKASCAAIVSGMADLYVSILEKKIKEEDAPALRVKFVFDGKGKYVQQPRFGVFVESMDVEEKESELKLTKTDDENQRKSLVPATNSSTPVGKL